MMSCPLKIPILFTILLLLSGAPLRADPIRVFLLGGQSNMQGNNAKLGELPPRLRSAQDDVLMYSGTNSQATFGSLQVGAGNAFGPEISFGRTLADGRPDDRFCLIKYAQGATNLHKDWDPATGTVYAEFKRTVAYGLEALTKAGHSYEIVGMCWTQGENDAQDMRTAAEYQADLSEFIADIRACYGAGLKFFISRLSTKQTRIPASQISEIRTAQENVADNDPLAYLIDTDSFELRIDNLHFEETGFVALGEAFATSYLDTLPVASAGRHAPENGTPAAGPVESGHGHPAAAAGPIPGSRIIATASSFPGKGVAHPNRTIDGSGLSEGVHGVAADTFWNTPGGSPTAEQWIQWDLGASHMLDSIHVWNHKDAYVGSVKSVDIYFSNAAIPGDPKGGGAQHWTRLGGAALEFPEAPESNNTGFDLATATSTTLPSTKVRYIRFALNSNWNATGRSGLAEVRFTAQGHPDAKN